MLFSSISFLYYFLPLVLICYFITPKKYRNIILLLFSLLFYAWGEPKYILLMFISIGVGYVSGRLIEKYQGRKESKIVLILSIIFNLGMLGYFKYADFFIDNFNAITHLEIPLLRIILPIGISFYTFQILSYIIDVYRKDVPAQKNILTLATYISFFPQLIAGPIVRYRDIERQLDRRSTTLDSFALGLRRFTIGLAKKVLIANQLGELCEIFKVSQDKSILFFWIYAIAFMLHIYFDFSGYSDMAIGLGKLFGFDFLENFNYPYISKSITEFWRRWHMSLGNWFRDYVYIPLGGNRCTRGRHIFNIFVVWFLTGFWHGASWNFIVWGLFFGILLVIEKYGILKHLEKMKVFNHIYVLFFVMISFVIFNAIDLQDAFTTISAMLGIENYPLISKECIYYLRSYSVLLIIAIVGATPLCKKIGEKYLNKGILESLFLVLLFILVSAYLVDGSFNPFLYFRF